MMKKNILFLILFSFIQISVFTSDLTDDYVDFGISEEVIIYGLKKDSSQYKSINKEIIKKSNSTSTSEVLKKYFNLSINNYGGESSLSTVNIRGSSGSRVLILLNGIPLNSNQTGDFDLSQIDINSIENIEVIYGGGVSSFGYKNSIGGIINIITKKSFSRKEFFFNIIAFNKFYYPDYYWTGISDKIIKKKFSEWYDFFDTNNFGFSLGGSNNIFQTNYSFNIKRANNNFIYMDEYDNKRRRTNQEAFDISNNIDFTIKLPSYSTLNISDYNYFSDKNIAGNILSLSNGKQKDLKNILSISYDIDRFFSDYIDSEFIFSHSYSYLNYEDFIEKDFYHNNSFIFINRFGFIINKFITIKPYYDITLDLINSQKIDNKSQITFNYGTNFLFKLYKTSFNFDFKLLYQNNLRNIIPIAKIGFLANINDNFSYKMNIFRLYRTPTFNDLYWPDSEFGKGNENLKSEDGIGGDFIFEYSNKKIFDFSNTIFWNYIVDGIIWESSKGKWMPYNLGKSLIIGISSSMSSNFNKYFYFSINYDLVLSYVLYNSFTILDDKRLPYKPVHTLGLMLTGDWLSGNITFSINYQSQRYTSIMNVTSLKDIFLFDIDINQNLKIITFFVSLKNLFNYFYYLIENYPSENGSVTIGLKINYKKEYN